VDRRDNILNFYSDLSIPLETKKDNGRWQSVLASLDQLNLLTPTPVLAPSQQNDAASCRLGGQRWY
jgi:hypothetical protein